MEKLSYAKRITLAAVCVALCVILPQAFHTLGLGTAFSPMHIPVLLCGMVCGGTYGLICGLVGPLVSAAITGMPGAALLPSMVPELAAYGLVAGLMMRHVRTGKLYADQYIALGTAMAAGRIVGGIAKALFYMGGGEPFTLAVWAAGYFVTTLPGIVCHLVVIPLLVSILMKARLIHSRYPKGA